jgi:hypothetical protein
MVMRPGPLLKYSFLIAGLCAILCVGLVRAALEKRIAELKCLQSFAWDVDLDGLRFGCYLPPEAQGLAEFTHPGPTKVRDWYLNWSPYQFRRSTGYLLLFGRLQLKSVRFDSLQNTQYFHPAEFLRGLRNFPEIRRLHLSGLNVPLSELRALSSLQNLQELNLDRTAIDDEFLAEIANHATLEILSLRDTRVTNAALERLHAPRLRSLSIAGTAINDLAVPALATFPLIETLIIREHQFSPQARQQLKDLPRLKSLEVLH